MLQEIDIRAMPVPGRPSEKTAFLGMVGRALGVGLRKYGPTGLMKFTNPLAQRAENAVIGGITHLGADPTKARQLVRGVAHKTIRDTASGAVAGGVLSGGISAAMADPGDRSSAFANGFGSGALSGAGFGAVTGMGEGLLRNAKGMHFKSLAKATGVPAGQVATRAHRMGWRESLGKAIKTPDPAIPGSGLEQGIARAKLVGGLGFAGAQFAPDAAVSAVSGSPPPPPPPMPQYQPNAPAVYSQPQYYKSSSAKIQLRPIDFTNLPSYH